MKSIKLITLLFVAILFSSCERDDDPYNNSQGNNNPGNNNTAFSQNFGNDITRTFLGTVVDINNNPINNVNISIGNETAVTDTNGVFIISNATVYEHFAYIKAEKTGYIHGSRSVVPSTGTNKVKIMLLNATTTGTTSSGTAETIALPNGASVSLLGEYVLPDGSAYSGDVNVILHLLDPTDEGMDELMPGMLYAANSENEERMLQTFGMIAIELRGSAGEDLNLAEGSSAEINVPLDASLVADAPSTIPLWYFDEDNGYWVEDGEATLVGNMYVGTVSHFSFWNCDIPAEAVNLCVVVTDENDNLLSNLSVSITSTTYGTRGGYTNENGEVCGLVPSNETLEVNVYNYSICGSSSIHTSTIGPFLVDANIGITVMEDPDLISETVIGTFNDCDGNPVSNGYVHLQYENQSFTDIVVDGDFEINLIRCDAENTFTVKAYDYDNIQETDSLNYTFTTPLTNLGTIQSCNTIEEFITYQVEDHPAITHNFNVQSGLDGVFLYVSYNSDSQEHFFNLNIDGFLGIDTYSNGYLDFFDENFDGTTLENSFQGLINVTAFGDVGEYIDINFTGVIVDFNSSDEVPITGTIHVLRDF